MQIDKEQRYGNKLYDHQVVVGTGCRGRKTITASDIIYNKYGSLSAQMMTIPLFSMEIRQKQLDKPLPKFKSFFAGMFNIRTKHQFLLFQSQKDYVTVDYYEKNQLVIRIGDEDMVLEKHQSQKRSHSEIVRQKSGVEWKKGFKKGQFSLGELIDYLIGKKLRAFTKLGYNGGDFSKEVFNYIKDQLVKKKESEIK